MRNILVGLAGATSSFIVTGVITFFLINFNINPFYRFSRGDFTAEDFIQLLPEVIVMFQLFFIPVASISAGLVCGLFAKNREYLVASISILPFCIVFVYPIKLLEVVMSYTFVAIGVYFGKKIRKFRGHHT